MKNIAELVVILVFILIFGYLAITTKGNDTFDANFNIDLSGIASDPNAFSYAIVQDEMNGEYGNTKSNGMYVMLGANGDGTYRFWMFHMNGAVREFKLQLDSATIKDNSLQFKNQQGTPLIAKFTKDSDNKYAIYINSDMSLGDAQLEGQYTLVKPISVFSNTEFQYR